MNYYPEEILQQIDEWYSQPDVDHLNDDGDVLNRADWEEKNKKTD
jgi:hypothetical protein